jgi:hypothetical protein
MNWSEARRAGYEAGRKASNTIISPIECPEYYGPVERGEFVAGFCLGVRMKREDDLIDEIEAGCAS